MTERLLEHFSEISSDWFWEMDADLRFSYFSKRLEEATGVDRTAALGKSRREIAANSADPGFWAQHIADLEARRPFRDLVYPYPTKTGRRWFKISGQPVFGEDGTFLGYRGVGTDITAEKEMLTQLEEALVAYEAINAEFDQQNKRLIEQEQKLIEQSGLLAATLDHMDQGLMMFDAQGRVLVHNRRALELLDLPADLFAGTPTFAEIVRHQMAGQEFAPGEVYCGLPDEEGPNAAPYRCYERTRPNGTVIEVRTVRLPGGGAVRSYTDVTTRRRQEQALEEREQALAAQNQRFDAALTNMPHGLCMFDAELRLILGNAAWQAMYELPDALTQPGTPLSEILAFREARGNAPVDQHGAREARKRVLASGGPASVRTTLQDGRVIQISSNVLPSGGFLSTHEDLTERIRAEAQIAHMARHDALTNLPNRVLLRERMEEALRELAPGGSLAVLFLDLDGFKGVNDTLGHAVGDVLLQAVTQRLRHCASEATIVARLGGDEFAILIENVPARDAVAALARRIIASIAKPYDVDGHHIVIGTSIGVAFAPSDGMDPDTLLKNADVALYRAKSDGRGTWRLFEPEMDARLQERRRLELALRRALAAEEFELYYQPVLDAQSSDIRGFEALLRWHDPERGMIPPDRFIPLAEEIGLIIPLGEWVIRRACAEAARWPAGIKVAVNLSPVQFRSPSLVPTVVSALASTGLEAARLELEITETVLLQENETTLAKLHQLRGLGVRIALDDFGTGYCSLSYLRAFPFDKIKIDRSFIRDLSDKADCLAIVRAVATLGTSLGMTTTAEGIETEEQLRQVRENGCTEVQGYHFSPPVPASRLGEFLPKPHEAAAA